MLGRRVIPIVAVLSAAIIAVAIASTGSDPKPTGLFVSVGGEPVGPAVPSGFLGFSFEYEAVPVYAGTDPRAVNPVLLRLIRNLSPGQAPQLRIGGDSSDRTWWPVPKMVKPGGVKYSVTPRWAAVTRAMARSLGAQLVLGVNMEANSPRLAAYEARQFVKHIGSRWIRAIELGNEPELYAAFPWYQRNGHGVKGRTAPYGPPQYTAEFTRTAKLMPPIRLAGPATGEPGWEAYLPQFVKSEPRVSLVTIHHYATRGCFVSPSSPNYHTIANLLSVHATRGLAQDIAPWAHLGPPTRLDELNSVNCGGVRGVSDRFASALWALDTLFEIARTGISGVNFHTFATARYAPFVFHHSGGRWSASVTPLYYGILMFAQAATPGSRLLAGSGQAHDGVRLWALRTPDHKLHVVLINFAAGHLSHLSLRLPGARGSATLEPLRAPGLSSAGGVTIGGRSFGASTATGRLRAGPRLTTIAPVRGRYDVTVPPASAALLAVR